MASSDGSEPKDPNQISTRSLFSAGVLGKVGQSVPQLRGSGRVGLLGGSFNPPHLGHVMLAYCALANEALDAIWVIPTVAHAFAKTDYASFEHRLAMCTLAFAPLGEAVSIVDVERHLPQPNYTFQLLHALHAVRPGLQAHLLVGSDILGEFDRWMEPDQILAMSQVVVLPREGFDQTPSQAGWPQMRMQLAFDIPEISSTQVRAQLRAGQSAEGFLDARVSAYVAEHGLFLEAP